MQQSFFRASDRRSIGKEICCLSVKPEG